ncbi:hypothetical protein [Actinomyces faecalis]|uniref:hypothetical protein n=1 Tax=Actinomyces faecalis TaxID=2722820 RepID=UPI001557C7B9|nr:hypothetical protein [Actinomyces faecalis]
MREYVVNGFHMLLDERDAERLKAEPVQAKAAPAPKNKASAAPGGRRRRPTAKE